MKSRLKEKLAGAKCLVYGLGVSGKSLCKYLNSEGAEVSVCDERKSIKETEEFFHKNQIKGKYLKYNEISKTDFLFRTPSVRPDNEFILRAKEKGTEITSECELFFARKKGKVYGVTGSDGKTTTVTLVSEILKASKNKKGNIYSGGNIGIPLISFLPFLKEDDITVAELSSFQLMGIRYSPLRAAVTNISQNHLDYHKDMAEYINAKSGIFLNNECEDIIIDKETEQYFKNSCKYGKLNKIYIGKDIYNENGIIKYKGEKLINTNELKIVGKHNEKNFMTACAVCINEMDKNAVLEVGRNFSGVEHRIEKFLVKSGVEYINSSIDTSPARSCTTIDCFDEGITLLCGGYDKNLDYIEFGNKIKTKVRNLIICGENQDKILNSIDKTEGINIYIENDFEKAVKTGTELAYEDAGKKGKSTFLMSNAACGFDKFENYKKRGETFKKFVYKYAK